MVPIRPNQTDNKRRFYDPLIERAWKGAISDRERWLVREVERKFAVRRRATLLSVDQLQRIHAIAGRVH